MVARPAKSATALRTIGELSEDLGVAQHILRYWETRFPQLKPMQRAGNRRYYRPEDVALARRIHRLLSVEGYTVKGVQQLLASVPVETPPATVAPAPPPTPAAPSAPATSIVDIAALRAIRDRLVAALADDLAHAAA